MKKKLVWITVILTALCAVWTGILIPYIRAESSMPENGVLTLRQQPDGRLLLSWPEADRADHYVVQVLRTEASGNREAEELYSAAVDSSAGILLPELPGDTELLLRVNSVVEYDILGEMWERQGSSHLEVATRLNMPAVTDLSWTAEPGTGSVHVTFQMMEADSCTVYRMDGEGSPQPFQILKENDWTLRFGTDGDLPMPKVGESFRIGLAACRSIPGLEFCGMVTSEFCVERQDLLDRELNVVLTQDGENGFALTWDETKGDYYEVQQTDTDGRWVTCCRIGQEEERRYVSGLLEKFRELHYRVVAVGGQTMEGSDFAAESETLTFMTRESSLYATVWPVKDLAAYRDTKQTTVHATAEAGAAYCVVDERDGLFGVRIGDQICYIDSRYCMINLPDYVGDLCDYRITNSTGSIYMVHEFAIPGVTAQVTSGYENVRQADGSYLVPLLYPTAKKLAVAAQNAAARGYRLKIYDSFRPQRATNEAYNRTSAILDRELPSKTYTGVAVSKLGLRTPEEGTALTYRQVMTDGKFSLNSFLAKGISRHNLGVALDLTLEAISTGEELRMQTSMHDLSWYSVTGRNNANAILLASIMTDAGFVGLSSEWWHFQDDASKDQLELPAVRDGVSAEGWTCDGQGWRYRDASGVPVQGRTLTVDGIQYTFSENGYLTNGEPAFG